jgi:hypothetical protein
VVSDDVHPRIPFENKRQYYEREPAVTAWVRERFDEPGGQVNFAGVVFNWRGAICHETVTVLKSSSVTQGELGIMVVRVLEQGYRCWLMFKHATWHGGRNRHTQT